MLKLYWNNFEQHNDKFDCKINHSIFRKQSRKWAIYLSLRADGGPGQLRTGGVGWGGGEGEFKADPSPLSSQEARIVATSGKKQQIAPDEVYRK